MTVDVARVFEADRDALWRAAYGITGTVADADEIVQETFVRLLEHTPSTDRPLRPWLRTVTANLARDRLRARRRRRYPGPWLPSVVTTGEPLPGVRGLGPDAPELPGTRLLRAESVAYAFVVALEVLTPAQRTVLVLRDVLGCTGPETAAALDVSEANVRVTLHRARKALAGVEPAAPPDAEAMALLGRYLTAVASGDVAAIAALLSDDAIGLTDGGGEVYAAQVPLVGPARIANVNARTGRLTRVEAVQIGVVAGHLAVSLATGGPLEKWPRRSVVLFDIRGGRIRRIWSVMASGKLA